MVCLDVATKKWRHPYEGSAWWVEGAGNQSQYLSCGVLVGAVQLVFGGEGENPLL